MTDQEANLAVIGLVISVGAAVLAAITALLVTLFQNRAAKISWRRDRLVNTYLELQARSSELISFLDGGYNMYFQGPAYAGQKGSVERFDELHGRYLAQAHTTMIVGDRYVLGLLGAINISRGHLLIYGAGPGGMSSRLWARHDEAKMIALDGLFLLPTAMRIDLGLDKWRRKKGFEKDIKTFVKRPQVLASNLPISLSPDDAATYLIVRNVHRLEDPVTNRQKRFQHSQEHCNEMQTASDMLPGQLIVAFIALFPDREPCFVTSEGLTSVEELAVLVEACKYRDENFRTFTHPWRDGPFDTQVYAWVKDKGGVHLI